MNWQIRRATLADVAALANFNCSIARETEGKELSPEVVTRGVARGMAQGAEVVYFLAEANSQPIGCLMLTREWSDWRDGWLAWVQSVYVTSAWRGRGVFRSLITHAVDTLRQQPDVVGVRLYVEVDNIRAQTAYARTGFVDPHYKVLEQLFRRSET